MVAAEPKIIEDKRLKVENIKNKNKSNVLLIGDSGTDVWVQGTTRKSPETLAWVFKETSRTQNSGLAANTYYNLKSLNPDLNVIFLSQSEEITKTRFIDEDSGAQIMRLDEEGISKPLNFNTLDEELKLDKFDVVVISDYNKNYVTEDLISKISNNHKYVFLDTKKVLSDFSHKVFCVKINQEELNNNLRFYEDIDELCNYCTYLLITRGKDGMDLYKYGAHVCHIKNEPIAISCVAGAGDSVLAGLVVRFLETGKLNEDTLNFANNVARIAVTKPGVVSVKRSELNL